MANIRTHGRNIKAELEQHLVELTEDAEHYDHLDRDPDALYDLDAAAKEIVWLRKEVFDIREQLEFILSQIEIPDANIVQERPWLRVATTVVMTFVLSKLVQRIRLVQRAPPPLRSWPATSANGFGEHLAQSEER